ncbi:hypothetical protein OWV82_018777 [Melia azedarach]|uniref:Uncharacterized protein n=1 Tax=Melia azedarach TaxID=155640 RepID=A0ACC1XBW7_MELAZ|nr:hypothetical protein OWV82_018777 [Melia azedarach]
MWGLNSCITLTYTNPKVSLRKILVSIVFRVAPQCQRLLTSRFPRSTTVTEAEPSSPPWHLAFPPWCQGQQINHFFEFTIVTKAESSILPQTHFLQRLTSYIY